MSKALTAKIVNGALSGARISFGFATGIAKTGLDTATDMGAYLTGVNLPNRIGDSLWHCGQEATTKTMNLIQKGISMWGRS